MVFIIVTDIFGGNIFVTDIYFTDIYVADIFGTDIFEYNLYLYIYTNILKASIPTCPILGEELADNNLNVII